MLAHGFNPASTIADSHLVRLAESEAWPWTTPPTDTLVVPPELLLPISTLWLFMAPAPALHDRADPHIGAPVTRGVTDLDLLAIHGAGLQLVHAADRDIRSTGVLGIADLGGLGVERAGSAPG
ncbi:MAG: hypothetical protein R3E83_02730 [Burkholderiaceae bacterium]